MDEITYPIRINRYLFLKGYCSRRKADQYIEAGKVLINGKKAVLGDRITENDTVTVSKDMAKLPTTYQYVLFNKPSGVASIKTSKNEKDVHDVTKLPPSIAVIGRLDKASRGLMLLSDDGRIVNALLNPNFAHEREYIIRVDKYMKEQDLKKLSRGIDIEGYMTKPAKTKRIDDKIFSLTLTEGKKHQIRRMCAALGYQVQDLKRTRITHLRLEGLEEGEYRALTENEQKRLLDELHTHA